jgi:hypothetical protein
MSDIFYCLLCQEKDHYMDWVGPGGFVRAAINFCAVITESNLFLKYETLLRSHVDRCHSHMFYSNNDERRKTKDYLTAGITAVYFYSAEYT